MMGPKIVSAYNKKKAVTSSNFFQHSQKPYEAVNCISKRRDQDQGLGKPMISLEQYFQEMEKKRSSSSSKSMGKRRVMTAAMREGGNRKQLEERKVPAECFLGPIQLLKQNNGLHNRPLKTQYCWNWREKVSYNINSVEPRKIIYNQQSFHEARPDSRYNQESICTSLNYVKEHNECFFPDVPNGKEINEIESKKREVHYNKSNHSFLQ